MTAEERMRERAAEECDRIWQKHEQARIELSSSYHEGAADAAEQCERAIRALPLEGEQGEPAKDQRGAPDDAAMPNKNSEHIGAKQPSGSDNNVIHPATALHHHSRTEQALVNAADGIDAVSQGRCKPAPAREPAVEEVNAAKKEGCFITAVGSYYQNVVGLDVALRHAGELDRLRAENAALREQLQGGVVVPEEVAARFSGDITIPKTLLAEAYRGLKRHYEMPEVRREIDRLFAAAKETKK